MRAAFLDAPDGEPLVNAAALGRVLLVCPLAQALPEYREAIEDYRRRVHGYLDGLTEAGYTAEVHLDYIIGAVVDLAAVDALIGAGEPPAEYLRPFLWPAGN